MEATNNSGLITVSFIRRHREVEGGRGKKGSQPIADSRYCSRDSGGGGTALALVDRKGPDMRVCDVPPGPPAPSTHDQDGSTPAFSSCLIHGKHLKFPGQRSLLTATSLKDA